MTDFIDDDLLDDREVYRSDSEGRPSKRDETKPLAVVECFETRSRRRLIDYFLTADIPDRGQNYSQIASDSTVSRNAVGKHVDILCDFDILTEHGDEDGRIKRYSVDESSRNPELILDVNEKLAARWSHEMDGAIEGRGSYRRRDDDSEQLFVNELFGSKSRRQLLDAILTEEFEKAGLNQSELGDLADVSRNSVARHIDTVVGMELLKDVGSGGIRTYRPTDGNVVTLLEELNESLANSFLRNQSH
jgi:DNA-binding transcriptional ArsR family regulator